MMAGGGSGREALPARLIVELTAKVKAHGMELQGDGGLITQFSTRILVGALDEGLTGEWAMRLATGPGGAAGTPVMGPPSSGY